MGALGATLAALALGGCGLAVGPAPSAVKLVVTRDFGRRVLHRTGALRASGGETVIGLLRSNYAVSASSGGGHVQGIDGVSGGQQGGTAGSSAEWFYYVNGVQASKGPAAASVHAGDHIWWDLHGAGQAKDIPAVVGSFPEPFLNGIEGEQIGRASCRERV